MIRKFVTITFPWLLMAAWIHPGVVFAQGDSVRCADQVWLVSARELYGDHDVSPCQFPVRKFDGGCWHDSSFDALQFSDHGDIPTVVFVHGYQTNLQNAQFRGAQVYQSLFGNSRCTQPVRFIIWAWKSEREIPRPVKDYALISKRAIGVGNAFAQTMNLVGDEQTTVIGYSLGAQVVVSGMTGQCQYIGAPIRLAVIAGANDCGFASGCRQRCLQQNILQTTVFSNSKDRVLKASNLICRINYGKRFRKFEELAFQDNGSLGSVNVIDISNSATRNHSVVRYVSLPVVRNEILRLVESSCSDSVSYDSGFQEPLTVIEGVQAIEPGVSLSGLN